MPCARSTASWSSWYRDRFACDPGLPSPGRFRTTGPLIPSTCVTVPSDNYDGRFSDNYPSIHGGTGGRFVSPSQAQSRRRRGPEGSGFTGAYEAATLGHERTALPISCPHKLGANCRRPAIIIVAPQITFSYRNQSQGLNTAGRLQAIEPGA